MIVMQNHELMAWLGPAADDLTPQQIERIASEARDIAERYPDPDEQSERDAALSAVVQYLLGDTITEDVRRALIDARRLERETYVAALQHAVMLVRDGAEQKFSALAAGVDRMSLLKALGKR